MNVFKINSTIARNKIKIKFINGIVVKQIRFKFHRLKYIKSTTDRNYFLQAPVSTETFFALLHRFFFVASFTLFVSELY